MFPDLWAFKNYADSAYLQKKCVLGGFDVVLLFQATPYWAFV